MDEGTRLRSTIWRFIRPRSEEMTLYACIAAALFAITVYQTALSGDLNTGAQELFSELSHAFSGSMQSIMQSIGDNKLLLFGFWFVIGTAVYILLWFVANILIDSYNNIVVSAAFVHPQSFHQSHYWTAILARGVLRVTAGIALVLYAIFWIKAMMPAFRFAYSVSLGQLTAGSVLNGMATALVIILSLHMCTIFYRIMLLRKSEDEIE